MGEPPDRRGQWKVHLLLLEEELETQRKKFDLFFVIAD